MNERRGPVDKAIRANNIGLLRLLFATLVVLSHAPEILDGNRSRELLTRTFGTLSLGEIAVDGFFLLSGYLVLGSYRRRSSYAAFVGRRALRIYPGFVVATLASILVVAPLAGGSLTAPALWAAPVRTLLLLMPVVPGAFAGLPYPFVNGSMWTIPCEFGCYLLLGTLGWMRAVRHRERYAFVLVVLAALYTVRWFALPLGQPGSLAGTVSEMIRFVFVFGCGGAFDLFRDRIRLTHRGGGLALAVLLPLMMIGPLAEPVFAILGGYLIFWFAFVVQPSRVSLLVNRTDLSYGLYLYAWPIQSLLALHAPNLPLWLSAAFTFAGAAAFGFLSWTWIERPALRSGARIRARRSDALPDQAGLSRA